MEYFHFEIDYFGGCLHGTVRFMASSAPDSEFLHTKLACFKSFKSLQVSFKKLLWHVHAWENVNAHEFWLSITFALV